MFCSIKIAMEVDKPITPPKEISAKSDNESSAVHMDEPKKAEDNSSLKTGEELTAIKEEDEIQEEMETVVYQNGKTCQRPVVEPAYDYFKEHRRCTKPTKSILNLIRLLESMLKNKNTLKYPNYGLPVDVPFKLRDELKLVGVSFPPSNQGKTVQTAGVNKK